MAILLTDHPATGGPGAAPRWTRADKDAIGTAYSALSRVWFTVAQGALTEVYYPTIDRPQIRDLQYLVTDGATFFHDEPRHLATTYEYLSPYALGVRITNTAPDRRYRIIKEILSDPHAPCVLIHSRIEADAALRPRLRLFALLAPHLDGGGRRNNAYVARAPWGNVLVARKGATWVALGATTPFVRCSCGYVGATDGWQDVSAHYEMAWSFDCALDGNVALTGELDVASRSEFVLGLAFGDTLHRALTALAQSLAVPFATHRAQFVAQWQLGAAHAQGAAEAHTGDGGRLYRISHSLLMAHEDKLYSGAMIASLSIPWGASRGDEDLGGYHLVWTRDMCQSATALLALGHDAFPFHALVYLACTQREDGGFGQNFWVNGEPYWQNAQLDEVAFPILLAWHLRRANALRDFDPWPMVCAAAGYLVREGPATRQERWEEDSGYSPSTLAAVIAALVCAAAFARARGEESTAVYLETYADFLEAHLETWTVTTEGTLVPGVRRHFIRLHPVDVSDPQPDEDANHGVLVLRNRPAGAPAAVPAKDVVDAGFLELVRYGVRAPRDPLVEDSLRVVDAVLKVETPSGPCWRRYNHDGYGEHDDGTPYAGWGRGRPWPLLTGERGHYELAAGRDAQPYVRAMEAFATATGLLPEQVWDAPDVPEAYLRRGGPTGGAMPLVWAHAEYIKLVHSIAVGRVVDRIPDVVERYRIPRATPPMEVWKFNRQVRAVRAGGVLRIQASAAFRLRWTADGWQTCHDTDSTPTAIGKDFVDVSIRSTQCEPIRFTFAWTAAARWEGRDFAVVVAR